MNYRDPEARMAPARSCAALGHSDLVTQTAYLKISAFSKVLDRGHYRFSLTL
ncbi:MAG TPA: hypothetical protein VG676_07635 [Chitinophagaceae bacterium]|nr:hypothetical protein [Chitinophagaceae bacterium]